MCLFLVDKALTVRLVSQNIYREMLSVALEQLHDAEQRYQELAEQRDALKQELRRYTARQVEPPREEPVWTL